MSRKMVNVVNSTRIENRNVHTGSASFHSRCKTMRAKIVNHCIAQTPLGASRHDTQTSSCILGILFCCPV